MSASRVAKPAFPAVSWAACALYIRSCTVQIDPPHCAGKYPNFLLRHHVHAGLGEGSRWHTTKPRAASDIISKSSQFSASQWVQSYIQSSYQQVPLSYQRTYKQQSLNDQNESNASSHVSRKSFDSDLLFPHTVPFRSAEDTLRIMGR